MDERDDNVPLGSAAAVPDEDAAPVGLPVAWADELSEGVWLTQAGRITWASEQAAVLVGRSGAAALLGRLVEEVLADAGHGLPGCRTPGTVECAVIGGSAERRLAVRCIDPAGASDAALEKTTLWVLNDHSERRKSEREVFELALEMRLRNRRVEEIQRRYDAEVEAHHQLLSVVSHELRTPLTVISGYGKLLLGEEVGPLTSEQRRFLDEIRKSCGRLDGFVAKLLGATGGALRSDALELVEAPLEPTINDVVSFLRPLFDEKGVGVSLVLEAGLPAARFDRMRIEQVLTNLLGNAAKYASRSVSEGAIEVATRVRAAAGLRYIEVAVSDDGPGLDAAHRERVFEPYVRTSPQGRATGLGLGLAICRRIVEKHGGIIDVVASQGGGCRFFFTLPLAGQDAAELRASA